MNKFRKKTHDEIIESLKFCTNKDKYDYSKVVYIDNMTKVEIICPIHGSFWQTVNSHLRGSGCPKCGRTRSSKSHKIEQSKVLQQFMSIHGDFYSYSKVDYVGTDNTVEIICPIHGSFWQIPYKHISGQGCPECGKIKSANFYRKTTEQFIKEARLVHDNKYDYSKVVYINAHIKIEIICPIHSSFWQDPNNHLKGIGCSKCTSSKGEKLIHKTLKKYKIKFEIQWHFNKHQLLRGKGTNYLTFDFFLLDYNLCIEYDGRQHFDPIKYWGGESHLIGVQKRDHIKNQFCLDNNVRLVRFPYWINLDENLILQQLKEKFTIRSILK